MLDPWSYPYQDLRWACSTKIFPDPEDLGKIIASGNFGASQGGNCGEIGNLVKFSIKIGLIARHSGIRMYQ